MTLRSQALSSQLLALSQTTLGSAKSQQLKAKSPGSQKHGGSQNQTRQLASVDGGLALANFVRSFELNSNNSIPYPIFMKYENLTTGTFNQVVKDQFAFPPERRVIGPAGSMKNLAVLETF